MIIELDYESETPIYLQLRNEIVRGIGSGQFKYGETLPAVRTLAKDLQVNTMTVSKAYNLLKQEGYIVTDRRHGAKVCPNRDESDEYRQKLEQEISLIASEAIVKGMDKEDFMTLCQNMLQTISFTSPRLKNQS
ncbi:GntR family transcriptional regulator [Traorella massiliensis]|uniref:GntR family transcriptional regulator n=1 Tax=Traorella massiliensis TaxID=1903263 RepID=UPI0008F897A9|nr:GntR family transcriptional regulator [Traorella massiliensis]